MDKSVTLNRIRGLLSLTADYIQSEEIDMAMATQSIMAEVMLDEGVTGEDVQALLVVNDEAGNALALDENTMSDLRSRISGMINDVNNAEEAKRVSVN